MNWLIPSPANIARSLPRRCRPCWQSASGSGSTAIGDGIAIPHGKLAGVSSIIGVFGRHVRGVDFDSLDGGPTHLFFLLVAPEDSASLHLKALARVSRLMKDPAFRERLSSAPDAAEIFRLIKEEDARH